MTRAPKHVMAAALVLFAFAASFALGALGACSSTQDLGGDRDGGKESGPEAAPANDGGAGPG